MFYVLRTNDITKNWGHTNIGVFKSKAKAIEHCKAIMPHEAYNTKLVIVKAVHLFEAVKVEFKDKAMK